jgi:hypothetical protein
MGKPVKKRIGQILCEEGFISDHQLEHALNIQKAIETKQLGQILLELGYIIKTRLNKAIAIQHEMQKQD